MYYIAFYVNILRNSFGECLNKDFVKGLLVPDYSVNMCNRTRLLYMGVGPGRHGEVLVPPAHPSVPAATTIS